jgi:hypothetical protein
MLHSEGRLMKGGNAHGTNIERTVGKVDGLVGFLGGVDGRCAPGGIVVGMFGGLGTQCRLAIPRRQYITNELFSTYVIIAKEDYT